MPDLPIIPLRPWQQNRLTIFAFMLYPDDLKKRKDYIRDCLIKAKIKQGELKALDRSAKLIEDLRMAPSSTEIERSAVNRQMKAYHAGLIALYLFVLKELNITTSINRATRMVETRYSKKRATGKPIPHSELSISKNWRRFKSVAHLWASHIAFYEAEAVSNSNDFGLFLAHAEFFRGFCEGIIAEKVIKPIVQPGEMWRVPTNYILPDIEPFRLADINEDLRMEIENYSVSGV